MANFRTGHMSLWRRVARFAKKPYREKRIKVGLWWTQVFPRMPLLIRLPGGQWWLVRNDVCGRAVLQGKFERAELEFVESYLRPGMTVLDIGAHHGFYTLLAARKVGSTGRVIAFEPSPRERKILTRHIRLNRCKSVSVDPFALGAFDEMATLFLVEGGETGCNSLRRPNVDEPIVELAIRTRRLDQVLKEKAIRHVDFVKLDAEGAELEILKGAGKLVTEAPRPVMIVEVQDIRSRPWGYRAAEIIAFLRKRDYVWFRPVENGRLEPVEPGQDEFDGNFVAIPREDLHVVIERYGL
jgi:FkbM family methyltransferase